MTLCCLPANDCGTFLSADLSRCKFAFGCKINHFLHKCAQLQGKVKAYLHLCNNSIAKEMHAHHSKFLPYAHRKQKFPQQIGGWE